MSNLPKKPTILDIADYLGISHSTVSRALNGKGRVSKETRERIRREARRLGYKPNNAAVALRSRASGLIGFLASSYTAFDVGRLLAPIQHQAHAGNYGILTGVSAMNPQQEVDLLRFMGSRQVEGIILQSVMSDSHRFQEELQRLMQEDITIVHLFEPIAIPGVHSVVIDHQRAGYLAGRHLLELGHRRILYLADDAPELFWPRRFSSDCYVGLLHAYQEMGLPRPPELIAEEPSDYPGYESVRAALESGREFTAILACNERVAQGAAVALKERDLEIPGDCSIVVFSDSSEPRSLRNLAMTAVCLPYDRVGEMAINLILGGSDVDEVESADQAPARRVITLDPQLIERESTRPLKSVDPVRPV